jgi:hypothetical protein
MPDDPRFPAALHDLPERRLQRMVIRMVTHIVT